jgi:hypothetical protein
MRMLAPYHERHFRGRTIPVQPPRPRAGANPDQRVSYDLSHSEVATNVALPASRSERETTVVATPVAVPTKPCVSSNVRGARLSVCASANVEWKRNQPRKTFGFLAPRERILVRSRPRDPDSCRRTPVTRLRQLDGFKKIMNGDLAALSDSHIPCANGAPLPDQNPSKRTNDASSAHEDIYTYSAASDGVCSRLAVFESGPGPGHTARRARRSR